jgi:hypothetical protein
MARKKRKIGFYYLTVTNNDIAVQEAYVLVANFIKDKEKADRKLNLGNNKFCLLDTFKFAQRNLRSKMVFKSATYNFRPNLIHEETVNERESPKQLQEGEIEKTHIVTKNSNGDIVFLMEKHLNGIAISQFVKYLNYFSSLMPREERIYFGFEIIVKDNFLDEMNLLSRVTCADIFVDKQLLGSDSLNYSNRINQVKHEVILTVKANNKDSIKDFARDIYAKLNGGRNEIRKIRIIGRNEENNEVIINTDFIERQEYILPELNQITGELSTPEVFIEMNAVINNFN